MQILSKRIRLMPPSNIIDDHTLYGSKGQTWNEEFVSYMKAMVTHPVYGGMPDAVKEDGKIQWEAPSNRSAGQYQFTHIKRREWWNAKARSLGIDTSKDQWISRTAKLIHPTGEKPCKRCGTIMKIAYVYPQANLIKRFKKKFGNDFEVSILEPISNIIQRAYNIYPDRLIASLKELLKSSSLEVPEYNDIDEIIYWIENDLVR